MGVRGWWWLTLGIVAIGCGPGVGLPAGSADDGGTGDADSGSSGMPEDGEGWTPPEGEDIPGPQRLAMAVDNGAKRLIQFGALGVVQPYGDALPADVSHLPFHQLEWDWEDGRGVLLLRDASASAVFGVQDETLTRLGADLPMVEFIELSREGHLAVLQHADGSTSIVDQEDTLVFTLPAPFDENHHNWIAFGDSDRWMMWQEELDPEALASDKRYWVRDLESLSTFELGTWGPGGGAFYTFETSVLYQSSSPPVVTWVDLTGTEIEFDADLLSNRVGPSRWLFNEGTVYELRDREIVEVGSHMVPEGLVRAYVPGAYAFVDDTPTRTLQVAPDGTELDDFNAGTDAWMNVSAVHLDPDEPLLVVTVTYDDDEHQALWRPGREGVRLEYRDDERPTVAFAPDGTLLRLYDDGAVFAVTPGADEEVELDVSPYVIEGFTRGY